MNNIAFTEEQVEGEKTRLRKKIFFALLIVDPETKEYYKNVDVDATFEDLMDTIAGVNAVLGEPVEMVEVAAKLTMAQQEFHNPDFEYKRYRKFVLDAGNAVTKVGR